MRKNDSKAAFNIQIACRASGQGWELRLSYEYGGKQIEIVWYVAVYKSSGNAELFSEDAELRNSAAFRKPSCVTVQWAFEC